MKKYYLLLAGLLLSFAVVGCDFEEESLDDGEFYEEELLEDESDESEDEQNDENKEDAIVEDVTDAGEETEIGEDEGEYTGVSFDTVDINGNPVTSDIIKGSKVVILNLWEPWCGPCVGEMPDLNELYENYKDKGLLIIGAYSTFEMDADAKSIVKENGITYPIIKVNEDIGALEQDYVPATYILDSKGNIVTEEPYVGAMGYSDWEAIIGEYLD